MSCPDRLSQWSHEVSTAFGHLSKPQVWGLVLWSTGIALSGAAGITQSSALLALVLEQQEQTVFQRLREWYLDANQKSGQKRRELDVTSCFAPLLCWIVRLWEPGNQQMVLVLDATSGRRSAGPSCQSAWSSAVAPFRWPGKCWVGMRKGRFDGIGKDCSSTWRAVFQPIGRCWSSQIQACMPAGCSRPSAPVAGIRSCASIWGSRRVWWERRRLTGSVDGFPHREPVGKEV
jgi:hypothetical protein